MIVDFIITINWCKLGLSKVNCKHKRILYFTACVLWLWSRVCFIKLDSLSNIHFLTCTIFKISQFTINKPLNIIYTSFIYTFWLSLISGRTDPVPYLRHVLSFFQISSNFLSPGSTYPLLLFSLMFSIHFHFCDLPGRPCQNIKIN
jgi:hypothetical protein